MDCLQCRRECGQNDKFCSECGYSLGSARTPVTELPVPGKETGDSTDVSSADLSRVRRDSIDWTRPNFLASPSTSESHTQSDNHTHSQSLGHPDTGSSDDEKKEPEDSKESVSASKDEIISKEPCAPGRVEATDVKTKSVTLCWERPVSMEGVSHEIHITYSCEGEEPRSQICAPNTTTAVLTDLRPGMEYTFNLTAVLPNGICSKTSSACTETKPCAPGRVGAADVQSRSVTLCWERPVSMEGVSHEIHITYGYEGEEPRSQICAPNTTTAVLTDLRPGMTYTFNLTAVLPNGICSKTNSTCIHTKPSAPGRVEATDVQSRSVTLCWERPVSMEGVSHEIHITYGCVGEEPRLQICAPNTTTAVLTDLRPGMEYTFNLTAVLPNGICSKTSSACIHTKPYAPVRVTATNVQSRSVTLCWESPVSMEGVSHQIHIVYGCKGEEPRLQKCAPNTTKAVLSDLRPGMKYTFNLTAVLPNGICSKTSSTCIHTLLRVTTEQQEQEKRYDPADGRLRFVTRPDDITLDDDPDSLRAEMSCGHAVTPQALTAWCRSLLDQGQYVFRCPALKDGTLQKCGVQWTYQEVRKLAVLTATEQRHFEVTLAALAAAEYCECKTCPGCQTSVERKDLSNLCVQCTVCTAETGRLYQFCWQCLQSWKGPRPRSDRCDNQGCANKDLELLKRCQTTSLPRVPGVVDCPSVRACPTCGLLLEHNRSGDKNLLCSRCQVEFCFVCLKLTPLCLQTSTHFRPCQGGVAPRQTSIPAWDRSSTP